MTSASRRNGAIDLGATKIHSPGATVITRAGAAVLVDLNNEAHSLSVGLNARINLITSMRFALFYFGMQRSGFLE